MKRKDCAPDDTTCIAPHLWGVYSKAASLPVTQRESYLDRACKNPQERAFVESLFSQSDEADKFFSDLEPDPRSAGLSLNPGDQAGPFKLLQKIGEGGFGVVFMAEQRDPIARRVALKIIKHGMDTREVIARFEAERQALALMDHPNIAKIFEAGSTESGRPFFVMELVKGIPLTSFCDEKKLTTQQRLKLFLDICSAVHHAHQKGIIHRDLKPSNILVTMHGDKPVPKIIDFGIAKATQHQLTEKTLFTRFEQFVGTPVYMSPEQAARSGLDIDTRSDLYALGILLYELLAGTPPFDPQSLRSAGYDEMRRIIQEDDPLKPSRRIECLQDEERATIAGCHQADPQKLQHQLRGELDWIVMKAIEKDRSRRYGTAEGFAEDIQRFLRNEPVTAGAPSATYRFRKFARRHKGQLTACAAVAIALVAGTAVSTWQAARAKDEAHRAKQTLAELRAAAPAFMAHAQTQINKGTYGEALKTYDYYLSALRPGDRVGKMAKQNLVETLPCLENLSKAGLTFTFQALDPPKLTLKVTGKEFDDSKMNLLADARVSELDLAGTGVTDVPGLDALPELSVLILDHTQIKSLASLRNLPLTTLRVGWTKVEDLTPLRGMPLRQLGIHYTEVRNLLPLAGLPLEILYMDSSKVTDLSPLEGLDQLKHLMLPLAVRDFTPLDKMPHLERVSFWFNSDLHGPTMSRETFDSLDPPSYVVMLDALSRPGWKTDHEVLDYFFELGSRALATPELASILVQSAAVLASAEEGNRYESLRNGILNRLDASDSPSTVKVESFARAALMKPLPKPQAVKILARLQKTKLDRGYAGFALALAAFRAHDYLRAVEIMDDLRLDSDRRVEMLASVLEAVARSLMSPQNANAQLAGAHGSVNAFEDRHQVNIYKYDWQDIFLARVLLQEAETAAKNLEVAPIAP